MLIRRKKKFFQGLLLIVSFAVLFWIMLLPLFHDSDGNRLNSLQYADSIFNELSKGSSWFIPEVREQIAAAGVLRVNLKIKPGDPELAKLQVMELAQAGLSDAKYSDGQISFSGNLIPALEAAVRNSADLYNNHGQTVSDRYAGADPLMVSKAWWSLLNPAVKQLQKQGQIGAAKLVEQVVKRAIEPGNNFYGLPSAKVSENIILVCALLAFYVLYAIWYGFAIYHLFDGFGLLGEDQACENVDESEV